MVSLLIVLAGALGLFVAFVLGWFASADWRRERRMRNRKRQRRHRH